MRQEYQFQTYVDLLGSEVVVAEPADNPVIRGATTDSRDVVEGGVFIAVPGSRVNGLDYVPEAVAAGAKGIIAETPADVPAGVAFAQVRDAYVAAGRVAEIFHNSPGSNMRLMGVTGTNGKTTVVCLLHHVLACASREAGCISTIFRSLGRGGREVGDRTTPMPFEFQALLSRMEEQGVNEVVMEVSSHAVQQSRCGSVPFAVAAFTNLTQDHLDYHGNMTAYFEAKKRLFTEMLQAGGSAVVNMDDAYGKRLVQMLHEERPDLNVIPLGTDPASRIVMKNLGLNERGGNMELFDRNQEKLLSLRTPMAGRYNLYNVALAAVMAREAGVSDEIIPDAVQTYTGTPGRLERIQGQTGMTAFVDYAHTTDALANVLQTLSDLAPKRLSVVCGCGGNRDKEKRPKMAGVAQKFADRIYLTSDNPRDESPERILDDMMAGVASGSSGVYRITDRREAIRQAVADASPEDIILVAGKGHEPYQVVQDRKYPFDDREEVRKAIQEQEKIGG